MVADTFAGNLDLWISQYLAGLCLVSIAIWCFVHFLRNPKWEQPVRDAAMSFAVIGVLTVFQTLRHQNVVIFSWPPLNWFCFTLLVLLEIFWISFLLDNLLQTIQAYQHRLPKEFRKEPAVSPYSVRRPR
ncbi:MAG: hypothetical protein ACYC7E_14630 [Armatimonadota bacterium]